MSIIRLEPWPNTSESGAAASSTSSGGTKAGIASCTRVGRRSSCQSLGSYFSGGYGHVDAGNLDDLLLMRIRFSVHLII